MILCIVWISFILVIGFSDMMDQPHYLLFSLLMLYFTYLFNNLNPVIMSKRVCTCFLTIPSVIIMYIIYVWNDFLNVEPIKSEFIQIIYILYTYGLIYVISEYK